MTRLAETIERHLASFIVERGADCRRHDDTVGAELHQRVEEIALFFDVVIVVGEKKSVARAIEFGLD